MNTQKHRRTSYLIAGAIAFLALTAWICGAFEGLENRSVDLRFRLRGAQKPHPGIAIIVFDEHSLGKIGRWPWDRAVHAKMLELLTKAGAKAVLFDVLFPEPYADRPASDLLLAKTLKSSGRAVLASDFTFNGVGEPVSFLLPIVPLRERAAGTGFTNAIPEVDGSTRRMPLFKVYNEEVVPSFALTGLSVALGKTPEEVLRDFNVPLDDNYEMMVNFAGGYQTFPYYSFYDVLSGSVPARTFEGNIVLLGGTAAGLFDLRQIPFQHDFPGVEIHASVISNILDGNALRALPWYAPLLLVLGFSGLAALLLSRFSPLSAGLLCLGAFAGYCLLAFYLFSARCLVVPFAVPMTAFAGSCGGVLFYRYVAEEKEKRKIKKNFSHYFSRQVMDRILSDPGALKLGGQRQVLTVLFSDIRGFTTLSESLPSEEVVELLNEYLSRMVEIVFKYDGTLDKFIGDAVMAFWGAPTTQKDQAKLAVFCAVDMIEELRRLQEKWRSEGRHVIDIGIGINTGEMVVGNMGSKDKMEYTVIGDNVNLGSRLEGLNKEYKSHIIISEATWSEVRDVVEANPLGSVRVKGKEIPVAIYEVLGRKA